MISILVNLFENVLNLFLKSALTADKILRLHFKNGLSLQRLWMGADKRHRILESRFPDPSWEPRELTIAEEIGWVDGELYQVGKRIESIALDWAHVVIIQVQLVQLTKARKRSLRNGLDSVAVQAKTLQFDETSESSIHVLNGPWDVIITKVTEIKKNFQ